MNKQLFENLLKDLLKANSARKLVLAGRAGYGSVEDYKKSLEDAINGGTDTTVKPTIHVVDIIDCSQSMSGGKIANAIRGINMGIDELKSDTKANYTYSLCNFSSAHNINLPYIKSELSKVKSMRFSAGGMTALRDAIGTTLNEIKSGTKSTDKVLVNIYTDGDENCSTKYSSRDIERLITDLQAQNFTITFIGTASDVKRVVEDYKIEVSNTLSYDGTAKGLGETFTKTLESRSTFASMALAGKDVSVGFYKDIKK